jgi:hypothetical protein
LRALIDKCIGPSSTVEDYVLVTTVLAEELTRLDLEAEKFPDEDIDNA